MIDFYTQPCTGEVCAASSAVLRGPTNTSGFPLQCREISDGTGNREGEGGREGEGEGEEEEEEEEEEREVRAAAEQHLARPRS